MTLRSCNNNNSKVLKTINALIRTIYTVMIHQQIYIYI